MNLNLNGLEPKEENVELKKINDDLEWDSKVQQSSQYSIYLTSNFLRWSGLLEYRYFLYENGAPILGCILPPKIIDGMNSLSYCMYQGIFFIENPKSTYSDDLGRTHKLSQLTSQLVTLAPNAVLALHHSIKDIRGIEWYLYEKGISSSLQYKVRYTGIIHLQDFSDFENYKKSIRKVRLQEFTATRKMNGVILNIQPDIQIFLDMYKDMFIQRGINIGQSELQRVSTIIEDALFSGVGHLLVLQENDGTPISGIFTLSDRMTDFYQFGASNPERLKLSGSSYLILHAIELAFINGRKYFDMVGMNSPNRGEYKASFNARVEPYFELELTKSIIGG
jgi:hypothetical protein